MLGYETIARELVSAGVDTVFAVMGDGNLHLLAELGDKHNIRIVHARHEQGAVAMADGYARFSGKVGVATVTHGPGLTNTATSLATAARYKSRLLLIAGALPPADVDNLQLLDQPFFVSSLGARSHVLSTPDRVTHDIRECLRLVHSGEGAVVLHAGTHIQLAETPAQVDSPNGSGVIHLPAPSPEVATDIAARLQHAEKPVILAGKGASSDAAIRAISELARHLGVPIVTSLLAKGNFSGSPHYLGTTGGLGQREATAYLADADVICVFGASLNEWTTSGADFRSGATVVHVDSRQLAIGRHAEATISVVADASVAAQAIRDHAPDSAPKPRPAVAPQSEPRAEFADGVGTVDPIRACLALNEALPEDHAIVVDGGHACIWGTQLIDVHRPRSFTHSFSFGSIGQSLAIGIGGTFALGGRRMTVIVGDGSAAMALYELETCVRYRLPITIVILNDDGFGIERHSLNIQGLPPSEANYPSPDFAAIAQAMGARGLTINDPESLNQLAGPLSEDGPLVLDVRINGDLVSDTYRHIKQALPEDL